MGGVNAVALSQDETTVLTVGQEKRVTYWDLREHHPVLAKARDMVKCDVSWNHRDNYRFRVRAYHHNDSSPKDKSTTGYGYYGFRVVETV